MKKTWRLNRYHNTSPEEALWSNACDDVFSIEDRVLCNFGSGGGSTDSTVTQTSTNLPAFAEPYYHDLMQRTAAATSEPYQTYEGQRVADFSPYEQEAMSRMGQLGMSGTNESLVRAGNIANQVGGASLGDINTDIESSYRAGGLGRAGTYDPSSRYSGYSAGQMWGPGYQAGQYGVGFQPSQGQVGYNPQQYDVGYEAGQGQVGFTPDQRQVEFAGEGRDFAGFDPETMSRDMSFNAQSRDVGYQPGRLDDAAMLQNYMSPYMQNVVDIEKREAARQGDIRAQDTSLAAAGVGSLGGYREAILQAENERNLQQEMSDIQTRGQQASFADAKQSFEQDRAARGQLEQFQQSQFGLNQEQRALQEQFGQSQFGINAQQAAEQEKLMQSQFGLNKEQEQARESFMQSQFGENQEQRAQHEEFMQSQFGQNEQARQVAESLMQQGFSMNDAAAQAKEQFSQAMFGMNAEQQQAMEGFMQQGFSMNEAARQAQEQFGQSRFGANEAARQAQEQYMQSQFGMNAANQQFASQMGLQRYQAYEQAKQAAAQMGLSADQANQAGQIAAMQGQLGLQQNQLAASNALAGFGGQQQMMEMERLGMLQGIGAQQRGLAQQGLDAGYQDFLRQQAYPYEQLGFMSNIMQGNAYAPGSTTTMFGQQPSAMQQMLGGGIAGAGLYSAYNQGGG